MKFRTQFTNYDPLDYCIDCSLDISETQQQFKDMCDVNLIMKQWIKTGSIDHVNKLQPQYADVSSIDVQKSYELINKIEEDFASLSSEIRAQYGNDPQIFACSQEQTRLHEERAAQQRAESEAESDAQASQGESTESAPLG